MTYGGRVSERYDIVGRNASLRDERILVAVEGTKPRERSNKKRY